MTTDPVTLAERAIAIADAVQKVLDERETERKARKKARKEELEKETATPE